MISYDNSIVINAPVGEVFTYANELASMPDWLTGLVEVRKVIGTGLGQQCEWMFNLAGVHLHGQAVVVEYVENRRCTHQSIGMFKSDWTHIVEPHEEGTKLIIEVEYSLPLLVLGKLGERLTVRRMARDLDSSLLNLKEALESRD